SDPLRRLAAVEHETEGLDQESRHLAAVVRVRRTVEGRREVAAAGDAAAGELLDPVREAAAGRAGHVVEDSRAVGRIVGGGLEGLQQEKGNLLAGRGRGGSD